MSELTKLQQAIAEHELKTGKPINDKIKQIIEAATEIEAIQNSELPENQKVALSMISFLKGVESLKPKFQNGKVNFKPQ